MKSAPITPGLLVIFFFCLLGLYTQSSRGQYLIGDNELRLNMGMLMAAGVVEGSYEYYLSLDTGVGLTVYADSDKTDFNGGFGVSPYIRGYFGSERDRSRVFIEGFGLFYTGEDRDIADVDPGFSSLALGLGTGVKFVNNSGSFLLELYGGLGRILNPEEGQGLFVPRAALSLGLRL